MTWNHLGPLWRDSLGSSWQAPAASDAHDAPEAVTYRLRVPGYRRKDLAVEVRDRRIVVRGERTRGVLRPSAKRSFVYSMTLPEKLDERNVAAKLARGVLSITVGKQPHARARRISVSVAGDPLDSRRERPLARIQGPTLGARIRAWLREARSYIGRPGQGRSEHPSSRRLELEL
jgi:HSP20 family molecular chaperone IbpA